MSKLDGQNRLTLGKHIVPWSIPTAVDVFFEPSENAVGIIPENANNTNYRIIDKRKLDHVGRLAMTSCILDALAAKPTDNFLIYLYKETIFIKKHDSGTG